MTYIQPNANGSATSANSSPVVIASDQATVPVSLASVPSHAVTNAGTFAVQAAEADGANVTLGAKADAKNAATDTTAITIMSVLKQISSSIQAAAASLAGTLTVGTHAVTQSGTWTVGSNSATGSTIPANAHFIGGTDGTNLVGAKMAAHGTNTTSGLLAAGIAAEFDDTSPTAVTENQFGNLRISSNRNLYSTIRDAAGNERGVNVTAGNALTVDGSGVTQPVSLATNTPTLQSGSTTAVTQATGSNLHTVVDSGTVTTVSTVTNLSQLGGTAIAMNTGTRSAGTQRVTIATDDVVPITDNSGSLTVDAPVGTPVFATLTPNTTGGWSVNSQTALTNSKVAVKASAGNFGGYMVYNPNSSVSYVQIFDVASGSVTLGTTAPTYVIPLPATAAANVEFTAGINHATAITLAATTTATGSTAPSTALVGFFLYK